jgi:hypothetical protein
VARAKGSAGPAGGRQPQPTRPLPLSGTPSPRIDALGASRARLVAAGVLQRLPHEVLVDRSTGTSAASFP